MKLGILLSGGKDSLFAAYIASKNHELACAIVIQSENKESYMFHTPNIEQVKLQADALGIPLVIKITQGKKEKELDDLQIAIKEAIDTYNIKGIVTGAVASQYQASRVQTICHKLNIYAINPLWQKNEVELLKEIINNNFKVIIAGVFAYPFGKEWLGRTINKETIMELLGLQHKYKINPAGEGGEIETFVLDCPLFSKRIVVEKDEQQYDNYAGTFTILEARLEEKENDDSKYRYTYTPTRDDVTIISTVCEHKDIYFYEFVKPITDIIPGKVIHISELHEPITTPAILTGTSLKDLSFQQHKDKMKYLPNTVLGICAGMELMAEYEGIQLTPILEIGPQWVNEKEEYFLHQKGIKTIEREDPRIIETTKKGIAKINWTNKQWMAVQYHPEVTNKHLLKTFLSNL